MDTEQDMTGWIFMVVKFEEGSQQSSGCEVAIITDPGSDFEQLLLDSGAFTHVCPREYAPEWPLLPARSNAKFKSVTGKELRVYGEKVVKNYVWDNLGKKFMMQILYIVCDVKRAIVATTGLLNKGFTVVESPEDCFIKKGDRQVPFYHWQGSSRSKAACLRASGS